ncbi:MAG: hypothetical protein WA637_09195 [Terriglobales bacterium]
MCQYAACNVNGWSSLNLSVVPLEPNRLATRKDLCPGTCPGSCDGSDGCAFATTGNRSDKGAQDRTAPYHFSCAFVCADTALRLLFQVGSFNYIPPIPDLDGLQVQSQLRIGCHSASRCTTQHQLS